MKLDFGKVAELTKLAERMHTQLERLHDVHLNELEMDRYMHRNAAEDRAKTIDDYRKAVSLRVSEARRFTESATDTWNQCREAPLNSIKKNLCDAIGQLQAAISRAVNVVGKV